MRMDLFIAASKVRMAYEKGILRDAEYKEVRDAIDRCFGIPARMKTEHTVYSGDIPHYYCMRCDTELESGSNYCPECGQKIDWEDE